jgi:hypothetical protein
VGEATPTKSSFSWSLWVVSSQWTRLPHVLAPDMHKTGPVLVCGCRLQEIHLLLSFDRSQMNARLSSVILGLLLTSLFPALAAADDMAIYLEFMTDSSIGAPTPFTDTIGHENAVWFVLPNYTIEHYAIPSGTWDWSYFTEVTSDNPQVEFTGADAEFLNAEMALHLNVPRSGAQPQVLIQFQNGPYRQLYMHAFPASGNPYMEAYLDFPVPSFELDAEGYMIPAAFMTTTQRATIFDPRDGMSNVMDSFGDGVAAFGPFIESVVEVAAGESCALGGTQVARGIDVDDDETVDVIYDARDLVCNVPPCTVTDNLDGTYTIACVDGGEIIVRDGVDGTNGTNGIDGSDCSATDNGDGTYTIACDDGSEVTVSDGASGSDGSGCTTTANRDGTWTLACGDGAPITLHDAASGGACTVSGIAEGEYTISCPDGTAVTLRDGADGDDGGCASAPVVAPRSVWFGALLIGLALLIRRRS